MENSMEDSHKTKEKTTMWPSNSTPWYISKKQKHEFEKIHPPQCHCSTIHNREYMEIT